MARRLVNFRNRTALGQVEAKWIRMRVAPLVGSGQALSNREAPNLSMNCRMSANAKG